ncbi:MAG: hypothetical protein AAF333_17895 [Planctomycetota bacterium]
MLLTLLAQAEPTVDDKMRALRFGFVMIVVIGIVGILLIVAMIGAWRNFHKRLAQLETERDEARQTLMPDDAWEAAGQRVEVEPAPGPPGRSSRRSDEDDEEDDDDSDLYGKDWEPGDDDDNPDDEPW